MAQTADLALIHIGTLDPADKVAVGDSLEGNGRSSGGEWHSRHLIDAKFNG